MLSRARHAAIIPYALKRGLPHGQRIASSGHFAFAKIRT
jgi:hypothetical protein